MVHPDCFGEDGWVQGNLTMIDKVAVSIVSGGNVEQSQAEEAAKDLVNIVYLNRDKCEFQRIYRDIKYDDYLGSSFLSNILLNVPSLILRIEHLIEKGLSYYRLDNPLIDERLYLVDTIFEQFGGVIADLIGFRKHFTASFDFGDDNA